MDYMATAHKQSDYIDGGETEDVQGKRLRLQNF